MMIITRLLSLALVVVGGFGIWCTNASAQGAVQASIAGVVRDTSGAVLPGVTIEASSPVLIEKSRQGYEGREGSDPPPRGEFRRAMADKCLY
jgi:hypothetical protein